MFVAPSIASVSNWPCRYFALPFPPTKSSQEMFQDPFTPSEGAAPLHGYLFVKNAFNARKA